MLRTTAGTDIIRIKKTMDLKSMDSFNTKHHTSLIRDGLGTLHHTVVYPSAQDSVPVTARAKFCGNCLFLQQFHTIKKVIAK